MLVVIMLMLGRDAARLDACTVTRLLYANACGMLRAGAGSRSSRLVDDFLEAQRVRLAAGTYRRYSDVVSLLRDALNN